MEQASKRSYIQIAFLLCLFLIPAVDAKEISYQHMTTSVPQSIHILEVDPKEYTILPVKALDQCVGRETVFSLAERKQAIAAVNGGFFAIGGSHDGCPCGILKISGKWYGLPTKPRGAIGWKTNDQSPLVDRVLTHLEGIEFQVDPQTDQTTTADWKEMDHIVGGTPVLIQNGKRITDFSSEKTLETFITQRHARTAVGILPNGNWVFVIVDGKQPDYSVGMTMEELALFMDETLGCKIALNLDGGGSSTCIFEKHVVNRPAGDGDDKDLGLRLLRPVSDAILILKK